MKRLINFAAGALALLALPGAASAATNIGGDTVRCTVSPGAPDFGCATGLGNGANSKTRKVTTDREFSIFVDETEPEQKINVDFSTTGLLTLDGAGGQEFLSGVLVLSFENLTQTFKNFRVLAGDESTVSLSSGVLTVTLPDGQNLGQGQLTYAIQLAVPEPATWLLFIFGLGLIGFSMRQRNAVGGRVSFV